MPTRTKAKSGRKKEVKVTIVKSGPLKGLIGVPASTDWETWKRIYRILTENE